VAESLTFGQTFQLRLEISLILEIVHRNYIILLSAPENHVFLPVWAYLTLIRPTSCQSGCKF